MTIKGTLQDDTNNQPIPGATFSVYYSGNMSGPPNATFTSGPDGSYTYTDASLDTASSPAIEVQANGYLTTYADPGFLQGVNTLSPSQVTTNQIPSWVWVVIVLLGFVGFIYFNKKYKLL